MVSLLLYTQLRKSQKPKPVFPLGKATTYITEPLDKDGYVDYEAALNARLGKGVRPEKNANVLLWKAIGPRPEGIRMSAEYYKYLGIEEPPERGDYFLSLDAYVQERAKLERTQTKEVRDQHDRAIREPWLAKDFPHLAKWLRANEKPLAIVREATLRTDYFNPLVTFPSPNKTKHLYNVRLSNVLKAREILSALACRAMLRTREKKFDDAWQDLLTCHRLGRLIAKGGTGIELLVGISLDAVAARTDLVFLEHATLTTKQLRIQLAELQKLPAFSPLASKVHFSERFTFLNILQLMRRYGPDGIESGYDSTAQQPDPKVLKQMASIDWEPVLRSGNRWYDHLVLALRLPDRSERNEALLEIGEALNKVVAESANRKKQNFLFFWKHSRNAVAKETADLYLALTVSNLEKLQDGIDRAEQTQRNLQVAFALAMYLRDHGSYPKKLDDLAPKYLAKVPDDLFSEEALHYRPQAKGYLLYSVGVNTQDDQGQGYEDDPGATTWRFACRERRPTNEDISMV